MDNTKWRRRKRRPGLSGWPSSHSLSSWTSHFLGRPILVVNRQLGYFSWPISSGSGPQARYRFSIARCSTPLQGRSKGQKFSPTIKSASAGGQSGGVWSSAKGSRQRPSLPGVLIEPPGKPGASFFWPSQKGHGSEPKTVPRSFLRVGGWAAFVSYSGWLCWRICRELREPQIIGEQVPLALEVGPIARVT